MKITPDKASYKIILNSGVISKEALDQAFQRAEQAGKPLPQVLMDSGLLKEEKLLEIFSKATGCPIVDLKNIHPDPGVFARVPVKFASYYQFFPIRHEHGKLLIAASRPLDIHTLDEMRFALGFDINLCFALEKDIKEMLQRHYGLAADTLEKILSETPMSERPAVVSDSQEVEDIEKLASTASVAHVVNQIILDAYKKRASDIHLEALSTGIRLRYRIDGILQEAPVPRELKDFFNPMLSRIKIMANLNVAERRLPQDGKLRVKTQEETLDLRVSFIPTANGESVVIRILPGKNVFKLEQLGFDAKYEKVFGELLGRPNGILFVTGPTGSGKSTTLYAALNRLNLPGRKIITIEDPVEYELDGVNQIHVAPEIGLTFSSGLRSMLRQDPDVMMVGEVRDLETADIAIRAALTGHLILSTLHTNDAASGVTRLLDIGVEAYLIASSVAAFIAQRLVRVICAHCKEVDAQVSPEVRRLIEKENGTLAKDIRIYHGRGCEHCNGTGYRGRMAIHEFLILNETMRKLIMAQATAETLKMEAVRQGMETLRQNGWKKVLSGVTTPAEVLEATEEDALPSLDQGGEQEDGSKMMFTEEQRQSIEKEFSKPFVKFPESTLQSMTSGKDHVDLRRFKRVQCQIPVLYRVIEYRGSRAAIEKIKGEISQLEFGGAIVNISPGGILFMVSDNPAPRGNVNLEHVMGVTLADTLEVGNVLELKITLPDMEASVDCMARVLRVMKLVESEEAINRFSYHVAMMFLAISSIDRSRLEKFCQGIQPSSDEKI